MPLDPVISRGIAPIGRDLPQVAQLLDSRARWNQLQSYQQKQDARQATLDDRETTKFNQEQRVVKLKLLAAAGAGVAKDPATAARWLPQLKEAGLVHADFDLAAIAPEKLQAEARKLHESASAELAAMDPRHNQEQQDAQRKKQVLQIDRFMSAAQADGNVLPRVLETMERNGSLPADLKNWRQTPIKELQADIRQKQAIFRAENADLFPEAKGEGLTDDQREYAAARQQGYKGTLQDWLQQGRRDGATADSRDFDSYKRMSPEDRALYKEMKGRKDNEDDAEMFESADTNAIRGLVTTAFGGFYDPISGNITGIKREDARNLNRVTARASQVFAAKPGVSHAEAVELAFSELQAPPAPPDRPGAAPSAGRGAPKPAQQGLPAQAASKLKPGVVTTFGNGERWTIRDGKAVRVP